MSTVFNEICPRFQILNLLVDQTNKFIRISVFFTFPLAYVQYHILSDVSPSEKKGLLLII